MEMNKVSRDVKCPVCRAEPRENCRSTDTGADMANICHFARWTAMLVTQGKAQYV